MPIKRISFGIAICAMIFVIAFFSTFSYTSICTDCGATEEACEWQLPLTTVTYWRTRKESATSLSRVVQKHALAAMQPHQWSFAAGGGNGVMCAIGGGRFLFTAISNDDVAATLDAVATYQGKGTARRLLNALLDPKRSSIIAGEIRMGAVPAGGFKSRGEFETWWRSNRENLDTMLDGSTTAPAESAG